MLKTSCSPYLHHVVVVFTCHSCILFHHASRMLHITPDCCSIPSLISSMLLCSDFELSDTQYEHALAIERIVPSLSYLRTELCSTNMSEACFWKIYFVLLHSKLNKEDAELLSTTQVHSLLSVLLFLLWFPNILSYHRLSCHLAAMHANL